MKSTVVLFFIIFKIHSCYAQPALSDEQKYYMEELKNSVSGFYDVNSQVRAKKIYEQLKDYSSMDFYVTFAQTFQWGQAHNGGIIILDYSTISTSVPISVLAFKFSHEWGHQALGHVANFYHPNGSAWKIKSSSTESEDEADYYAGLFLAKYAYNINDVVDYLNNLPNTDDHTHSSGKSRAKIVEEAYNDAGNIFSEEDSYFSINSVKDEYVKSCLKKSVILCLSSCKYMYHNTEGDCIKNLCTFSENNLATWLPKCECESEIEKEWATGTTDFGKILMDIIKDVPSNFIMIKGRMKSGDLDDENSSVRYYSKKNFYNDQHNFARIVSSTKLYFTQTLLQKEKDKDFAFSEFKRYVDLSKKNLPSYKMIESTTTYATTARFTDNIKHVEVSLRISQDSRQAYKITITVEKAKV